MHNFDSTEKIFVCLYLNDNCFCDSNDNLFCDSNDNCFCDSNDNLFCDSIAIKWEC